VITNGGPLVVLPRELVSVWRGTLPPLGVAVPEGWEWGSGDIVCDYDRACTPAGDSLCPGDAYDTWSVPVSDGAALVLDGEVGTTAIPWKGGLVVLRDAHVETEAEAAALVLAVDEGAWTPSPWVLDLSHGGLSMFDAAYAGSERESADGGLLEAELAPNTYRVLIAAPRDRLTLIRLLCVRDGERGPPARVTIT
jgi:hypothetical protein